MARPRHAKSVVEARPEDLGAECATHFGPVGYGIVSDADNGKITATVEMPSRNPLKSVLLRFRHPKALPMKSVTVNGNPWADFDPVKEVISLHDVMGNIKVESNY